MSEAITVSNGNVYRELRRRVSVGHVILSMNPRQPMITDKNRLRTVFRNYRSDLAASSISNTALERAEHGTGNTYLINVYAKDYATKLLSDSDVSLTQIYSGFSHRTLSFHYISDDAANPLRETERSRLSCAL